MEIGSEISQKIRSAIKAKLLELGAYVDDELPDYIMVMVANKRSRVQMKADLGLFLGVNTDPFTGWLHSLLGKLQTIKSDSDKSVETEGNADVLRVVKDKKKVGKLQTQTAGGAGKVVKRKVNKRVSEDGVIMAKKVMSSDRKVGDIHPGNGGIGAERLGETGDTTNCDSADKVAKRKVDKLGVDGLIVAKKVTSSDRKVGETHPDYGGNQTESGELVLKEAGVMPESFLNSKTRTVRQFSFPQSSEDALSAELQTITREVVNSRTVAVVGITKPTPVFKAVITAGSVHKSSTGQYLASQGRHVKPSAVVRKRRASTSVLDHISRSEDEAYDPYNPSVGAVASFSRVAAHKFNASTSLQVSRQTDFSASEGMLFNSQTDLQGEYGHPPRKLLKLSETVHLEDIKQALAEVLETTQAPNDDIAHFSRMVESSLRKLRPQNFSLAKLRIQQILFELESIATQENIVENKQNKNILEQASYLNRNSKCNNVSTYFQTVGAASDLDNTGSTSMPGNRRTTFSSPHTPPGSPPAHDANQNSDDQTEHSTASDQQIDNVDNQQERISSNFNENHVAGKYDCASSEQRTHFESSSSQMDRIIFHPKSSMESLKSSRAYDRYNTSECESKTHNRFMVKSREKESPSVKPQQGDQQSPISIIKTDVESPSSVHSSPLSNTSGLNIRRHVTSASRESTLSPHDLQPKPGTSHVHHKSKSSSARSKPPPPILVDSIHNRKRLESVESASVLRQNWQKDKSPRAADPAKSETQDSPRHYGPEALKVMAKNLKITVINKRAVNSHQESSSDDSDDDEENDSSDNEDDEEDEEKTKDEVALKKSISGQSASS